MMDELHALFTDLLVESTDCFLESADALLDLGLGDPGSGVLGSLISPRKLFVGLYSPSESLPTIDPSALSTYFLRFCFTPAIAVLIFLAIFLSKNDPT
jgi:hypothetical protein